MLSRVVESIYWANRYVERAENVARFIDVNLHLRLDMPIESAAQWEPLVATTGDWDDFARRYGEATERNVIQFLVFDRDNPNSILSCLWKARENARTVRDTIPSELWQQLNRFYLMVRGAAISDEPWDTPHAFFTEVKMASHLLVGIAETTMSHGEAWHFGRLGRLIERADQTSRILDVKYYILLPSVEYVGTPYDLILWSALLKSASAYEMYRKQYHAIRHDRVAQFLILDPLFPRAMRFCLSHAEQSLHAITGTPAGTFSNKAERLLGRLRAELDYADINEIIARGLHEYLDEFQSRLNELDNAIFETFFALRPVPGAAAG